MRGLKHFLFILILGLCLLDIRAYAIPFNIVPIVNLPTSVLPGQTVEASYLVTNATNFNPPSNMVKWLPLNVAINPVGTTCTPTNAFPLAPGQSCRLNLSISGPIDSNDPNPHNHLFICMSDGATCAGPSPQNSLNVSQ